MAACLDALDALGEDHGPPVYLVIHLQDIGTFNEVFEMPFCAECAVGFRTGGKHRIRSLASAAPGPATLDLS